MAAVHGDRIAEAVPQDEAERLQTYAAAADVIFTMSRMFVHLQRLTRFAYAYFADGVPQPSVWSQSLLLKLGEVR